MRNGRVSERSVPRRTTWGWCVTGALLGGLVSMLVFAPAAWLADAVAEASGQRFLLADAQGSIWTGSAVPVLTGGSDSRDAVALPGRLSWKLRPRFRPVLGFELRASQACCLNDVLRLRIVPGVGRVQVSLPASSGAIGQWPASWLAGLGTPWNTLQLGGEIRLTSPGLDIDATSGRLQVNGRADVDLLQVSSRLSTLDSLGSYHVAISGDATGKDALTLAVSTVEGKLRLSGDGQWSPAHLRFRGDARASEGAEAMLNNLLNIIGRRQGALSIISIG